MSSIAKIKELLDDFQEKEALNKEEISEIEKQISELEERIVSSRERLESVARDREKVEMMKNRYAGGDWSDVLDKSSGRIRDNRDSQVQDSIGSVSSNGSNGYATAVAEDNGVADDTRSMAAQIMEEASSVMDDDLDLELELPPEPELELEPDISPEPEFEPQLEPVPMPVPEPQMIQPPILPQVQHQPQPQHNIVGQDVSPVALDNPNAPPILPGIPNPPTAFDAMQTPPGMPSMGMMQPPQPAIPVPPAEPPESLFPFSQGADPGSEIDQDAPWGSAPQVMGWETSETSSQFPLEGQPQPPVPPQMPGMQPPQAAHPQAQQLPPQQQAVLQQNQSAPGGFDISDALKPEGEEEEDSGPKDNKKINDALRGLFS